MANDPTPTPPPTPNPTPNPTPVPTAPWFEGKADAETIGHWDNKGWKKDDPIDIAIQATKQARKLEAHYGVPADRLLKLPENVADEAGWKGVYSRLGVPDDAKGYDLATVKHTDGRDIDATLADSLRTAMLNAHVPKERATDIAKAVIKHADDQAAARGVDRAATLKTEREALMKEWTPQNFEFNKLTAMQGAKRLSVDPETVSKLEGEVGYAKIMEMFRKVGAGTNEDTFIEGGKGGAPTTQNGAAARKAELMADKDWAGRYLKGGAAEVREMNSLNRMIHGEAA